MTDWLADRTLAQTTPALFNSRRFTPLPDVFLHGESVNDRNDEPQEITVARAEARARVRQRRNGSRLLRGTDRQFAEALHREADTLHYKGDYETALVLYHRAASVCPRDSSHGVAARRTAAAINALSNPSKTLNGLLPKVRNGAQQSATVCPESAAIRASRILAESSDPVSVVPQILGFFDGRADFWRTPKTRVPPPRRNLVNVERSTATPMTRIRDMERVLNAGDAVTALGMGNEILINLGYGSTMESSALNRYEAKTHRLMALAHIALGRHDRAASSAFKMTRAALTIDVPLLITEALVTLGKVHLTFGHLKAAAQAWERLVPCISEPVPRAWLFHEIGRCHLENGDHKKALKLAARCVETAEAVNSEKWTFHGRLLLGQTLAQLGRFTEAASALRSLTLAGKEAGDARTLAYVRDLAERVARASNCEIKTIPMRWGGPKVQRELNKSELVNFAKSETRSEFSSDGSSQSDEHREEATLVKRHFSKIINPGSLYSDESSLSPETPSQNTALEDKETSQFETAAAAGDPGNPGEQESSILYPSLGAICASHESITTGRTYQVSSPVFQRSVSTTPTPGCGDLCDSETASAIFAP